MPRLVPLTLRSLSSLLPPSPSPIISWAKTFFSSFLHHRRQLNLCLPPNCPSDKTLSNSSCGPGYLDTDRPFADFGYQVGSSTNTSSCASLRSYRTKKGLKCASRPRLTSPHLSSYFAVGTGDCSHVVPSVRVRWDGSNKCFVRTLFC